MNQALVVIDIQNDITKNYKVVSDHIFVKTKSNALTSEAFSAWQRLL